MRWRYRGGCFDLSHRTLVMGVLNITPDSFSDGGQFSDPDDAISRARVMVAEGADIIDVGGESTRPGSAGISADEEMQRVVPVIRALAKDCSVPLSIDTSKAAVADAALQAGAHMVNDVTGLADPEMAPVVRTHHAGLVIMHMQGTPRTMQENPVYHDVVREVGQFLAGRVRYAVDAGIPEDCIVIDPGIGFGKSLEHNITLLKSLKNLGSLGGRPVLAGVSRKRFVGMITGREVPDRLPGSLAAAAFAIMQGASILRVHDVKESCDIARMIDRLTA